METKECFPGREKGASIGERVGYGDIFHTPFISIAGFCKGGFGIFPQKKLTEFGSFRNFIHRCWPKIINPSGFIYKRAPTAKTGG